MLEKLFENAPWKRTIFFIVADSFIFYMSFYSAYLLRFNIHIPPEHIVSSSSLVLAIVVIKIIMFYIFGVYSITWRYFVLSDVKKILYALISAYLLFVLYIIFFYSGAFPRTVVIIDFLLSFLLIVGLRLSKRLLKILPTHSEEKPTIIIGANQKSLNLIANVSSGDIDYDLVAIVDDDRSVINSYLSNIKVHPMSDLEKIIKKENINSAIITKNYTPKELDLLFEELTSLGITNIKQSKILGDRNDKLQDISIEDLLARSPKDLDLEVIESFIKGKTVMITGAGGSIGSEIARQCDRFGAKRLLLLDHSEYNLYNINEQVLKTPTETLMQSVVDKKLLEKSFKKYKPQIVIHAAAYKHVPLCEENIEGAILNNIIGTKNTIDLAIEHGVEKFVFISTDKAVRPTNVMGATKRVCELYAQNIDNKNTLITAVRFGNVLGSSGSVIPKFKLQIEKNEPLSVTHPDITRYFMLIPEACQLVLQAASIARNRELFVLDMGQPVKIVDLAKKMLKLYNKEELGIEFTSLRSGEKLYEELLLNENDKKTIYNSIFVTSATRYDLDRLNSDIENLLQSDDKIGALKKIVPEFEHKES
jgi:UDP-N-acetyl-D-glucosamine 4,6-dehydratase